MTDNSLMFDSLYNSYIRSLLFCTWSFSWSSAVKVKQWVRHCVESIMVSSHCILDLNSYLLDFSLDKGKKLDHSQLFYLVSQSTFVGQCSDELDRLSHFIYTMNSRISEDLSLFKQIDKRNEIPGKFLQVIISKLFLQPAYTLVCTLILDNKMLKIYKVLTRQLPWVQSFSFIGFKAELLM